ncbi:MAG: lactonase family protein [Devosia sp.]|nr:lactonase family protein [Devosia sp.]
MTKISLLSGSYSGPGGAGLGLLNFDTATGGFEQVRSYPGTPDVSWIAFAPTTRTVYVTDEMAEKVGAFTLAPDLGAVTPLGYQPTGAKYPCYIRLSPKGTKLAAANYGDDSVPVFNLDAATGALKADPVVLRSAYQHDKGHAHWTQWSPEADRLYTVDLGHDEVRFFPYAGGSFTGGPVTAFALPAGSGPRHLAFHPGGRFAYLWTEYANVLTALKREADGTLTRINALSALPAGFTGTSYGAHIEIAPNGETLYVSNRGHNSIAVFAIAADGSVGLRQIVPCGGDWPRFFILLGRHLVVANQKSDTLVSFDVAADGTLSPSGQVFALEKPVCLLPV